MTIGKAGDSNNRIYHRDVETPTPDIVVHLNDGTSPKFQTALQLNQ